jgi:molybdate transport system substrate-binding protein
MRLFAALLVALAIFPARAERVTVFAAASLQDGLDAVVRAFERMGSDTVTVSYAGSNALGRQIENGAPADIFISADTEWMDYVEQRGLAVPGTRVDLLSNELVLIAPATSRAQVKLAPGVDIAAILGDRRIALADPDVVPSGKYAKAAFTSLGAWGAIEGRVAPTENVRAALMLVARGEAPLGVVYRTDALAEKKVRIVDAFPANSHAAVVYPMVRLKRGSSRATSAFITYVTSPGAAAIFKRHGFGRP